MLITKDLLEGVRLYQPKPLLILKDLRIQYFGTIIPVETRSCVWQLCASQRQENRLAYSICPSVLPSSSGSEVRATNAEVGDANTDA